MTGEAGIDGAGVCTVLVTAPDMEVAESLGTRLVEEGRAACANLLPGMVSLYRWEGDLQRDDEVLLILKSTLPAAEALRARVVELHPYEVPEVLVLPVGGGHPPYLAWVRNQVGA